MHSALLQPVFRHRVHTEPGDPEGANWDIASRTGDGQC